MLRLTVLAAVAALAAPAPCSARGLTIKLPPQQLPPAVASMRRRIFAAALRCDYATLVRLGNERRKGLEFSFGAEASAAAYWSRLERRDEPVMRYLAKVLTLPVVRVGGFYAWPSAHQLHPSEADWRALRAIYPQRVIDQMRRGGIGYYGYRVGISAAGDWRYFVTGD